MPTWWSPPKQRQRWGETEILPSGNWGQIFFDLFYVGGAYNLGNVIKTSCNSQGILYFCGAAFPIMMMWYDKLYYDARFTTCSPSHNVFHRCLEVLQLCCVATALSRIRSVDEMSHICDHVDMFQFSISLFINYFILIIRYVEVAVFGIGDRPAIRNAAIRDIRWIAPSAVWLMVASLESGYYYFSNRHADDYDNNNNNNNDNNNNNGANYNNYNICNDGFNRPIIFCLASWLTRVVMGYCEQVLWAPKAHRMQFAVPMNIHFCMHRYGEWFMLMFGESIISLLIVDSDNESASFAIAFYSGILSVIFLAHLHFRSEPRDITHALSRSRHSSYLYTTVMVPIYSAALIAIGVSYKIFLYAFMYKSTDGGGGGGGYHRNLGEDAEDAYEHDDYGNDDGAAADDYGHSSYKQGGSSYSSSYIDDKQHFSANLFSGSIATVLICTDLLVLLHRGVPSILAQARQIPKLKLVFLALLKYSLVLFLATMSTFQHDPHLMTFCGLGAILAQEFLRNAFHRASLNGNDEMDHNSYSGGGVGKDDSTTISGATDDSVTSQIFHYHIDKTIAFSRFEQEEMASLATIPTANTRKSEEDSQQGEQPSECGAACIPYASMEGNASGQNESPPMPFQSNSSRNITDYERMAEF